MTKMITIIIPCYRSEKSIEKLIDEICLEFDKRKDYSFQIILVNDGSPDGTYDAILRICSKYACIIGIDLARNFGQPSAKMAALPFVKGDYIVFMDDDGQHMAEGIFTLISKLNDGYDIAYAHFPQKQHTAFQRFGSMLNLILMEIMLGKPKDIIPTSFMAMQKFVVDQLLQYNSPTPHVWGYLLCITKRITGVEMVHRKRLYGNSGYNFTKQVSVLLNGFISFSVKPLRVASFIGILIALSGFVFGLTIIVRRFGNPDMQAGYASIMAVMLFIGGIIMVLLGVLGEYTGRILLKLNNLPQYVIREVVNGEHKQNLDFSNVGMLIQEREKDNKCI